MSDVVLESYGRCRVRTIRRQLGGEREKRWRRFLVARFETVYDTYPVRLLVVQRATFVLVARRDSHSRCGAHSPVDENDRFVVLLVACSVRKRCVIQTNIYIDIYISSVRCYSGSRSNYMRQLAGPIR